jgi:4-amino-4-deoxy-L-arabinose transferase-like glycosyltransferase
MRLIPVAGRFSVKRSLRGQGIVLLLAAAVWLINAVWLTRDTRPPVWDMALHQAYAFNYLPGFSTAAGVDFWRASGNYPPFVHLAIAACYILFYPSPHIAVLANLPATLLLLWAIHGLASDLAGTVAARWACMLTAFVPYMVWMSRETVLDYWLSAWVAAALLVLLRSRAFASRTASLLMGVTIALGMLTKWLFAGFLLFPVALVCLRTRIWRDRERLINLADTLLIAAIGAAVWYLPNISGLARHFVENARIGAREGEPPILSFQSLIYYLRLLEGYQLFGILFAFFAVSTFYVIRKKLLSDGVFLLVSITGGWLVMTLLRTKDPRFTMPLLGLLAILPGTWIQSWPRRWPARAFKTALLCLVGAQAYMTSFGIRWLPQEVVIARGYQGSLAWDWNLYSQHYFHVLGAPRREDWRHDDILHRAAEHARKAGAELSLAIVPDLPRFNAANFMLYARLRGIDARVDHPQSAEKGPASFARYNYAVMKEGDQGMPWTTTASISLNKVIVDEPRIFELLEMYPLPDGDYARLYCIRHARVAGRGPEGPARPGTRSQAFDLRGADSHRPMTVE